MTDDAEVSAHAPAVPGLARGNAASHVYEALRAEILSLRLAPGEVIDDSALGRRLGVSRTPIREALARLAGDGLVVLSPNRGVQVAEVNLMEMPRFAETLSLLQRAVLRLAALRRSSADLVRIDEAYGAFVKAAEIGTPLELTLSNRAFHVAIADATHNRYLAESYSRLLDEGVRMLSVPFAYDPDPSDSVSAHTQRVRDEHLEMIEVIRAGDAERAEALGAEHTELFRSRFLAYLGEDRLREMRVAETPRTRPPVGKAPSGPRPR